MTVTVASFRVDFPEFADTVRFPDSGIQRWLTLAPQFHNADRWGDSFDLGVGLYTAHFVALGALNAQQAAGGGVGGVGLGMIASQGGGSLNVSFDTSSVADEGAGHWNMTTYGLQRRELIRLFGAGPLQVGAGVSGGFASAAAYAGPYTYL